MVGFFVHFIMMMVGVSGRSGEIALPLMDEVKAALTANIDVSNLNLHLKLFIEMEIRNQVKDAMNDTIHQVLNEMDGLKNYIEQTNRDTWIQMYQNLTADNKHLKQNPDANNKQFEMKQNLQLRTNEQKKDNEFKPVVLTACHLNEDLRNPGIVKFPTIKTSVGVPDLSAYQSTGKFTCHEPGHYFVMTTMEVGRDHGEIQIMVNSIEQHKQFITGLANKHWTPGTAAITLNLELNDQVWINWLHTNLMRRICFNIFKIR